MEWACTECGRTYDEPPADVCVACGNGALLPAEAAASDARDAYLDTVRRALLDPASLDRGLTSSRPMVDLVFRLVVVFSVLLLLVVVVAMVV